MHPLAARRGATGGAGGTSFAAIVAPMKAWFILGAMALAAAALVLWIGSDREEDVHRLYADATREKPVVAKALEECGELVHYFSDRKPTSKKKGDLDDLRTRFETLDRAARDTDADAKLDRNERKKRLTEIEEAFYQLRTDATDLRARLTEMKNYDTALKPLVARLGRLKAELLDAQSKSADPEFQQRANALLTESTRMLTLSEQALKRLSVKITEGRVMATTSLKELDDLARRFEELLATQKPASTAGGGAGK